MHRVAVSYLEVLGGLRQREHVVSCVSIVLVNTEKTAERLTVLTEDVHHDIVLQTAKLLRLGTSTRLHQAVLTERTSIRMRRLTRQLR